MKFYFDGQHSIVLMRYLYDVSIFHPYKQGGDIGRRLPCVRHTGGHSHVQIPGTTHLEEIETDNCIMSTPKY